MERQSHRVSPRKPEHGPQAVGDFSSVCSSRSAKAKFSGHPEGVVIWASAAMQVADALWSGNSLLCQLPVKNGWRKGQEHGGQRLSKTSS